MYVMLKVQHIHPLIRRGHAFEKPLSLRSSDLLLPLAAGEAAILRSIPPIIFLR